jgi:myo-inositol-1(or 4)-monophosphatase
MSCHHCSSKVLPLRETDLSLLIRAAREAGEIAKVFFGADPEVWHKPDEAGPVTEADLAVNTMLEQMLLAARPDYGWLSEESADDEIRLDRKNVFVVDPIDGTRAFIEGSRDWSHSLAVVTDGVVTAAAVYLPMRDQMYAAQLGGGATLNDVPICVSITRDLDTSTVLSNKWNFRPEYWAEGKIPTAERHFRSSLAFRLCLVAEGRFDTMLTLRPTWEWDVAAGALIVTEAGGTVRTQDNLPPVFNNPHPQLRGFLAGPLSLQDSLQAALA